MSLCLLASNWEIFAVDLLAQVHSHVGGFPSGGETVMNLVPLCHSMDMVCRLSNLKEQCQHGLGPSWSLLVPLGPLSKVNSQIFIQLVTSTTLATILLLWWDNACWIVWFQSLAMMIYFNSLPSTLLACCRILDVKLVAKFSSRYLHSWTSWILLTSPAAGVLNTCELTTSDTIMFIFLIRIRSLVCTDGHCSIGEHAQLVLNEI